MKHTNKRLDARSHPHLELMWVLFVSAECSCFVEILRGVVVVNCLSWTKTKSSNRVNCLRARTFARLSWTNISFRSSRSENSRVRFEHKKIRNCKNNVLPSTANFSWICNQTKNGRTLETHICLPRHEMHLFGLKALNFHAISFYSVLWVRRFLYIAAAVFAI